MISVVVLMVIFSLYCNVTTSVIIIQQTLSSVYHRTNSCFVALLCTKVSSFLLQGFGSAILCYFTEKDS